MNAPTNPGPPRAWIVAWSLQGALVMGLEFSGWVSGPVRLALLGPLAGLPLLGLFLWLRKGDQPENA